MLDEAQSLFGEYRIHTSHQRGWTPEELAERAMDKIIYVGKDAHPFLKDQAEAYKQHIHDVVLFYLRQAVQSDRTTIANRLRDAGYPELTSLLEN